MVGGSRLDVVEENTLPLDRFLHFDDFATSRECRPLLEWSLISIVDALEVQRSAFKVNAPAESMRRKLPLNLAVTTSNINVARVNTVNGRLDPASTSLVPRCENTDCI